MVIFCPIFQAFFPAKGIDRKMKTWLRGGGTTFAKIGIAWSWLCLKNGQMGLPGDLPQDVMKHNETQTYGTYLSKLSTEEIDKLLSSLLQEMRRRDSARVTEDVLARSQALRKLRTAD